jgi:D-amino-acid dehydrogenase
VLVVGAGVVGLFSALYCAERGFRVTVLERHGEQRDGCSFGNTGMIVPSHFVPLAAPGMVVQGLKWMLDPAAPFHIAPRASWDLVTWGLRFARACSAAHVQRAAPLLRDLSLASRACYEALSVPDNAFGLQRSGVLMLCRTAHALEEETRVAQHARSLGMPAEVLGPGEAAALEPDVRMDIAGAVHYPLDCNLVPERLIAGLQRRLAERGVQFLWDTEVRHWDVAGNRLRAAGCNGGARIEADEFVLAAGSWSAGLARALGLKLPLQAGKGYSLTCPRPPQMPRRCAVLVEARVAVSPMAGALRFGGTMEIAGLDETIDPIRVRSIMEAIPRYYPAFGPPHFDGIAPWRGLRPCSPDGLPYLGRTARYSNLVIATGHAMMGVSLGAITGRIASQLMAGEETGFDLALLSPDRYGGFASSVRKGELS